MKEQPYRSETTNLPTDEDGIARVASDPELAWQLLLKQDGEIERLRAALTEIATGRDAEGKISDFPRALAQEALDVPF